MTKSSCPFVDLPVYNEQIGREYTECDAWRKIVVQNIREIHPQLVVMASIDTYPFSYEEWSVGVDKMLKEMQFTAQNVVILRDTPGLGFDAPTYLARRAWFPNPLRPIPPEKNLAYSPLQIFNTYKDVVKNYSNASVIDMLPYICPDTPCQLVQNNQSIYRDSHHLSVAFSKSMASNLANDIHSVLQGDDHTLSNYK